ncbi:hypothetical protein H8B06_05255 [Sphingobacterium sp. DN00404]|uniref:Uncharacterized protein n=1 Tax=Sphingobacterium micropteri TaxID=2763501 RepID=A0ABR7YLL2_9SPHI|nr:hypothetical protein [Sphingobacterium micropteri]MBD1432225.1 hypothetical protein [Sphingobacterium micropteri]
MEEQNSMLSLETGEAWNGGEPGKSEKLTYIVPKVGLTFVELENNIAAGSITVNENNNVVEESWMVEEDDRREIDLDFFN